MKTGCIFVPDAAVARLDTLTQFRENQAAQTPLGRLFIELCEEETWSRACCVHAHFSAVPPCLYVDHPALDVRHTVVLMKPMTIAQVRDHICDAFMAFAVEMEKGDAECAAQAKNLRALAAEIRRSEALTAIRTTMHPNVGELQEFPCPQGGPELLLFAHASDAPTFYAVFFPPYAPHPIVLDVHCEYSRWKGRSYEERFRPIFVEIARGYLVRQLTCYRFELTDEKVVFRRGVPGSGEPVGVRVVSFLHQGQRRYVLFGDNGLPTRIEFQEPAAA